MRYNELFEGIEVVNENQQVIGTSPAAGRKVCALCKMRHFYIAKILILSLFNGWLGGAVVRASAS